MDIAKLYLGSVEISKAYLGDTLVYDSIPDVDLNLLPGFSYVAPIGMGIEKLDNNQYSRVTSNRVLFDTNYILPKGGEVAFKVDNKSEVLVQISLNNPSAYNIGFGFSINFPTDVNEVRNATWTYKTSPSQDRFYILKRELNDRLQFYYTSDGIDRILVDDGTSIGSVLSGYVDGMNLYISGRLYRSINYLQGKDLVYVPDTNYLNGTLPIHLFEYNGTAIPYSDGWYGLTGSGGSKAGTFPNQVLEIGDSFGFKSQSGQGFTCLVFNQAQAPVHWENSIGFGLSGGNVESVDFAMGGGVTVIDQEELNVWYMVKRDGAKLYSLYKHSSPASEGVLIGSIDTSSSSSDFKYPYFVFWNATGKVRYPQFFTAPSVKVTLTVNVTGATGYKIYINNTEQSEGKNTFLVKKDSLASIRVEKDGYIFDPLSIDSLLMNENKIISFTGSSIPANVMYIGNGSGTLTINGSNIPSDKDIVIIKPGSYSSFNINNIDRVASPVIIKNGGTVKVTGTSTLSNLKGVTISGKGVTGLSYGIEMHDISYRGITINGILHDFTLEGFSFKNIGDYLINSLDKVVYNGTKNTRHDNIKFISNRFENASNIIFTSNLDAGTDNGLVVDLEFAYNHVVSASPYANSVLQMQNVARYNIHNNIINEFSRQLEEHNGVFFMRGSGKLHNNKLTNYSGNIIRAWAFNRIEFPDQIKFYNNIGYNSYRYGMFEIQGLSSLFKAGVTEAVNNSLVYNNTGGLLDTSNNWEGTIVDLYGTIGTTVIENNLGFQMHKDNGSQPTDNTLINNSGGTSYTQQNNRYFSNWEDAVVDLVEFESKITGVGAGEIGI